MARSVSDEEIRKEDFPEGDFGCRVVGGYRRVMVMHGLSWEGKWVCAGSGDKKGL